MKRIAAILLCFCLILGLGVTVDAAPEKQHDYSTDANSGIRHQVCTTLLGTSADQYYTGQYTYAALYDLPGQELLTTLRTFLTQTHTKKSTYANCRDMAVKTDCLNGDGVSVSLIYTSYSATWNDWSNIRNGGWDREHVWPKALGGFSQTDTPGCDLHHVRPSDSKINNTRGSLRYGNVTGGTDVFGSAYTGASLSGSYNSTYFEPLDNVKGDVARICLYLYVRYGGQYSMCNDITNVFQSVDVLLDWCELDPVDTWEMGRNEVVAAYQGNRNVFIDYPELAWLLFDQEIPADMVTPSGYAATPLPCTHNRTKLRNEKDATCKDDGYTGDLYCRDCSEKITSGTAIPALGHTNQDADASCDRCGSAMECGHSSTELRNYVAETCGNDGYSGDMHCIYCDVLLESGAILNATGEHSFQPWTVILEPTTEQTGLQQRSCATCGFLEDAVVPKQSPPETEPSDIPSATTQPAPSQAAPSATEPEPDSSSDSQKEDYRWLVCAVLGLGAIVSVVIVLIQTKRKQ